MLLDIEAAAEAGLQGVVFGVLTANGDVDMPLAQQLTDKAKLYDLGITFHRAIDQSSHWQQALENVIELGCERILTSGLASNVKQGIEVLKEMVALADGRISIMAGAGLTADNVQEIVSHTGVREVHLSGKTTRASYMNTASDAAKMGNQEVDDFIIPITNSSAIEKVVNTLS
jgi:copper homeostasis protein